MVPCFEASFDEYPSCSNNTGTCTIRLASRDGHDVDSVEQQLQHACLTCVKLKTYALKFMYQPLTAHMQVLASPRLFMAGC